MRLEGIMDAATAMRAAGGSAEHAAVADAGTAATRATVLRADAAPTPLRRATVDAAIGADALNQRVRALIERPAADLSVQDWDSLGAALAADPHGTSLIGPRTALDVPPFAEVVDSMRLGDRESAPVAERYLAAWRARATGPEAMLTRARELMAQIPSEMSPEDRRALAAIVDADTSGAITGVPAQAERQRSGLRQTIVSLARSQHAVDLNRAFVQFANWSRDHDPAFAERWNDAVQAAVSKRWNGTQYWLLRAEADRFEQLPEKLAHLSPADRRQVAWIVADRDTYVLAGWMQRHDPEYPQLLLTAVDKAAAGYDIPLGGLDGPLLSTLREGGHEQYLAGRPIDEQRNIVQRLWSGERYNAWRREHDPEWPAVIDDAVEQVLAGESDFTTRFMLKAEGEHLQAALAKRPFEDRVRVQQAVLREAEFVPWLRANAPDWSTRVDAATKRIASGVGVEPLDARVLKLDAEENGAERLLVGRPFDEQDRIASVAMDQWPYLDWKHANDPAERAAAEQLLPKVLDAVPLDTEERILLSGQRPNVDELVDGRPWPEQEAIAKAVLGERSTYLADWLYLHHPDRASLIHDAAVAVAAGTHQGGQFATLSQLGDTLPEHVADLPLADRIRIYQTIGRSSFSEQSWFRSVRAEAFDAAKAYARDADVGELPDDARVVLALATDRLDELVTGHGYEAQLRIADAALDNRQIRHWKIANDPDRVERVRSAAIAFADGAGTGHDARVLRGESNVMGVVADRPYEQQLRVAQNVFAANELTSWVRANDPEYLASIDDAIDSIVSGSARDEQLQLIELDRANAFRRLSLRPPAQHDAVAAAILGLPSNERDGVYGAMRTFALDARTRLEGFTDLSPQLQRVRDDAAELVDRNIRRMARFELGDPNRGYANHPDYAELGRVEASIKLLDAVGAKQVQAEHVPELLTW